MKQGDSRKPDHAGRPDSVPPGPPEDHPGPPDGRPGPKDPPKPPGHRPVGAI